MNVSSLQPLNLNTKYMRLAYVSILASILLVASLAIAPSLATGDDDVIVADGTLVVDFATCLPPFVAIDCISIRDVDGGSKTIATRDFFITLGGDFVGHGSGVSTVTIDGPIETNSIVGSLTGSVGGKVGTFAFLGSTTGDFSGPIIFEGNFAIIEGSGVGDFEGVCGFGTFGGVVIPATPLDITMVLAFGDDCEDFSVNDFLDILSGDDSS